jgi:hypothetical protein
MTSALWLLDVAVPRTPGEQRSLNDARAHANAGAWRALDGSFVRLYARAAQAPGDGWTLLVPLMSLEGASAGEPAAVHYVVEADVEPRDEADFNAWYEREHLPGLARVPGTIRAERFRRATGAPRYLACYLLTTPATLERPEWLSVRGTDWSSRVRPTFRNPRRTMFAPLPG